MMNRINHHVHTTEYLNKNQHGFRPQASTIDSVKALIDYVEEGFSSGEVTVLVSLDVEGAFNSAWWPSILKSLNDSGCPRNLHNVTKSFLSKRWTTLQTNNIKVEAEITRGRPQGTCCGPGFWSIFYNSLLNLNFTHRTKCIAFADDLILATRGKSVIGAENISNSELTKISAWATANKIRFNEQKSNIMLLSRRKRKERKDLEMYLNFRPLTQVISLKNLGIIIDTKLTFRKHINYIKEKCSKLIFALSRSAKINWGLSYNALKSIYTGAILSFLLCGAPIWINALSKACYRTKFTRVQRLINIRISKSYLTVSNEALCMITGLTPIDIKIEETTRLFQITKGNIKDEVQFDHDTRTKHWLHPAISFTILDDCKEDDSTIQIYTDGSKNEQGVGAGLPYLLLVNTPLAYNTG